MNKPMAMAMFLFPILLLGAVVWLLVSQEDSASGIVSPSGPEMARLGERTDALEKELAALRQDLTEIRAMAETRGSGSRAPVRPAPADAEKSGEPGSAGLESRLEALEATLASSPPIGALGAVELGEGGYAFSRAQKDHFRALLDDVREEERQEEQERRRAREEEQIRDRVKQLAEKLGLDGRQVEEMTRILTDESTSRREMFERMRSDDSADPIDPATGEELSMRDQMRQLHESTTQQLQRILSPWQYEEYQNSSRFGRGFFGGRMPDFGRGGDRGNRDR